MFCQCDLVTHRVSEFLTPDFTLSAQAACDPGLKCLCKPFVQGQCLKDGPDGLITAFFQPCSHILSLGPCRAHAGIRDPAPP